MDSADDLCRATDLYELRQEREKAGGRQERLWCEAGEHLCEGDECGGCGSVTRLDLSPDFSKQHDRDRGTEDCEVEGKVKCDSELAA